ncbi:MAG: hypothetical protein Q9181_001993 [Wetmoreana brouardii]
MVRSVGYVAETKGVSERMEKNGYRFVEENEVMRLIESAILDARRVPDASQVMIGIASGPGADWGNATWREDPRFAGLCLAQSSNKDAEGGPSSKAAPDIQARLARAASWLDAVNSVCDTLVAKVAEMFSLPLKAIDRGMRLAKYGVDSLVAVELRKWLGHVLQAQMSIFEVMQSLSLEDLADKVAGKNGPAWEHSRTLLRPSFNKGTAIDLPTLETYLGKVMDRIPKDGSTFDLQPLLFSLKALRYRQTLEKDNFQVKEAAAVSRKPYVLLFGMAEQTNDERQLGNEVLQALMAAQETTAALISNVFFLLSRNKTAWQQLRQEAVALEAEGLDQESLHGMKYLRKVLNESENLPCPEF